MVEARVNEHPVLAVLDTAAQVLALSAKWVQKEWASELGECVYLQGLAGSKVPAKLLRGTKISLISRSCVQPLHVAEIVDEMLLGLDILGK